MASLAQTSDGDIAVLNGRFRITRGDEEKAQKIKNRFRLFLGEWFADVRQGTPWYQLVIGLKNPDLGVFRQMLRDVILSVEGIRDVAEINLDWDRDAREIRYEWRAISDAGVEITGSGEPFIVDRNPERVA